MRFSNPTGTVLRVLDDGHVVVEGVNRVKKHQKPNPMRNIQGGVVEKEMPIQASNVALFNAGAQKADRVGYKLLEDGRKVRVFKSSGEEIPLPRRNQGRRGNGSGQRPAPVRGAEPGGPETTPGARVRRAPGGLGG